MTPWARLLRLEIKNLFAGVAVTAGFVAMLVAGLYGLYSGHTAIARQRDVLEGSRGIYETHRDYVLSLADDESIAGDRLYYLFVHTHHEPSDWAPFSLGGRSVHAYNLKVRLLTLEGQLYDSELTNPIGLVLGSFDAALVLIVLFPLLVIATTHGAVSEEKEAGTWNLVRAQGASIARVLALKLGVRITAVLLLAVVLVSVAAFALQAPFMAAAQTAAVATAYLLVWFAVSFAVITFDRGSSFNAVALLSVWLAWSVVGPSLGNVLIATALPVPEALELTVVQRQGYHESWDRPQQVVMDNFYRSYPDYAQYPIPDDRYSNGWYYAMNQMGDDEARTLAESYRQTIIARQRWTDRVALLMPSIVAQRALNHIARTDLESHLDYLDSVRDYHEELKTFFYPIVFREDTLGAVDWSSVPRHWHSDRVNVPTAASSLSTLFATAAIFFGFGCLRYRARWRAN